MRKRATYPAPRYRDPNDVRMLQVIKQRDRPAAASVNIVGVPYDGAVLGRKGAAGGPGGIREAMSAFSTYNVELDLGLEGARVYDLGDVVVEPRARVTAAQGRVESEVALCLRNDSLLVILGGDNSISLPAIRACGRRLGKLGLVVVDSHLDLRGRIGGEPTSGSSYGLALETVPELEPKRVVEIGAHGFLNSRTYVDKAKRLGVTLRTSEDVALEGPVEVAKQALETASKGADAVYLSVDMDAVGIGEVPGVSAPSAGGITAKELQAIVLTVSGSDRVAAADIVEVAPSLDPVGTSQRVAATTLVYMIAGFQMRQKVEGGAMAPRRRDGRRE